MERRERVIGRGGGGGEGTGGAMQKYFSSTMVRENDVFVFLCVYICVRIHIHTHLYVYTFVCVHVCMCTHLFFSREELLFDHGTQE